MGKKPIIGIMGGICSGKSTVAAEFAKLGCMVIDADKMAKALLDEPAIQSKIIERFGKEILGPDGKIDRRKLANIVFGQPQGSLLQVLTDIIHPPVLEQTNRLIEAYQKDDKIAAIVVDMPLLAEVGWEKRCDALIFVHSELETRLKRAKIRGLDSEKDLKIRENFQISLDKKQRMSHYIVYNDSGLLELTQQISRIFNSIVKNT